MPAPDRRKIRCQNCRYWAFDMDMDAFCTHPKAASIGTDVNAMRSTRELRFAEENCGPEARFFEQGTGIYASEETNL